MPGCALPARARSIKWQSVSHTAIKAARHDQFVIFVAIDRRRQVREPECVWMIWFNPVAVALYSHMCKNGLDRQKTRAVSVILTLNYLVEFCCHQGSPAASITLHTWEHTEHTYIINIIIHTETPHAYDD
jgi:hypothetical protein